MKYEIKKKVINTVGCIIAKQILTSTQDGLVVNDVCRALGLHDQKTGIKALRLGRKPVGVGNRV